MPSRHETGDSTVEPGLMAMCYLSWCKTPKTWCRFLCFLTTLAHGILYAFMASYVLFRVDLYEEFPVLGVIRHDIKAIENPSPRIERQKKNPPQNISLYAVNVILSLILD